MEWELFQLQRKMGIPNIKPNFNNGDLETKIQNEVEFFF